MGNLSRQRSNRARGGFDGGFADQKPRRRDCARAGGYIAGRKELVGKLCVPADYPGYRPGDWASLGHNRELFMGRSTRRM